MFTHRRATSPALVHGAVSIGMVLAVLAGTFVLTPQRVAAVSNGVVISQVYGGGGNSGAPLTNDFIELFNRGTTPASLNGWSVQYASATGIGNFGASATQLTELPNVTLQPGQYYLIQETGGTAGNALPTPDLVDTTPINLSATAGKVALATIATSLGCNTAATCTGVAGNIVDLVGYGSANFFEGAAAAPAPSNTTSIARADSGCVDSDNNSADFSTSSSAGGIIARNTASDLHSCSDAPTATSTSTPGSATSTPAGTPTSTPTIGVGATRIHDIQGAAHISPLNATAVSNVPGIVTVVRPNGFYLQDPNPDADDATSEAIFVFTRSAPSVSVGDAVLVSGTVSEFRPGGSGGTTNLTTTELDSPSVIVQSNGNALPAPVVIGVGGRTPPTSAIEDDATGSVETSGVFDPASDGIDFYESMEAMRVQVNDAVAVGPTSSFGEIPVLPDNGANAGPRTTRGGIVLGDNYTDNNPERIFLDDTIIANPPSVNVGDTFPGAIIGVLDYSFGNFKLDNTAALPAPVLGGLAREVSVAAGPNELSIATFNVENLDPADGAAKFNALAALIVANLKAPDIISIEEVQDNNGPTNDAVVDANLTYQTLIDAITAAGGPTYVYRQINPVDDQDGGEPGGNIRVGFLFRTDRGLAFVDRPGAASTTANSVVNTGGVPQLQYSPGRIDPTNAAFNSSRKPLAGEFTFNGQTIFVIANHFNSKGGDQPLFGRFQPSQRSSEVQRQQQAQIVASFVASILAIDPAAKIAVLGDLNDFEFSPVVTILKQVGLNDLIETLPKAERYSYVFEGNSQTLDHILVSNGLLARKTLFDSVHVNAEFADQTSDHDPQLAIFNLETIIAVPPTDTPTSTATDTATPTDTATSTATNTPTATATPTNSPTVTATPSATSTPVRKPRADVAIVKTGVFDSARRIVTFTLSLSNNGPNAAQNAELIDELDGDLDFVRLNTTGGSCAYNSTRHRITCMFSTLDSGATTTITIVTTVDGNPRSISNTARVEADTRDPQRGNNRSSVRLRIR